MFILFGEIITIIFLLMTITYGLSLIKKNVTIIDIAWGLGFALVALFTMLYHKTFLTAHILTTVLVSLWSLRLITHIFLRNKGKSEDPRYQKFRHDWGNSFWWRSYFQIFLLQGVLMFLVAYEVIVINESTYNPPLIFMIIGSLVWLIGFIFETLGDYQLLRFIQHPANKGKILTTGVWAYTRHPNYFGEVTMWWGIYLIACTLPGGLVAFISPLTITILILGVSGIPMTEKLMENNPDFQQYKKRTSPFFPWFKK